MPYKSVFFSTLGFCLVSLIVFVTVAFGERWMYENLGLWGAYAVWTTLFIVGGGFTLSPIVVDKIRPWKFCLYFFIAFFGYACAWIVCYYFLRNAMGEWLGAFTGCICLALLCRALAKNKNMVSFLEFFIVLFFANSVGYFLGRDIFAFLTTPLGMILWGLTYGLGLGFGLSYSLHCTKKQLSD